LKALQQPSKEALRGFAIPPRLNENVEHNAVLIHGLPKIVLHSLNPDEYLVEVPLVPRSWPAAAQAFGKGLSKLLAPTPNGLIGDNDATIGQQELNISIAEAEHVVQPDRMADDLGGKAVAIVRVGRGLHPISLGGLDCQSRLP